MPRQIDRPIYPNFREALRAAFGDTASKIKPSGFEENSSTMNAIPVHGAQLVLSDEGRTFVLCGGEVVACLSRTDEMKGCFFIVRNDDDGAKWAAWQRDYAAKIVPFDSEKFHTPRPSAKYQIVYSL